MPPCELVALIQVLVARGFAPLASNTVEHLHLAASVRECLREALLNVYQESATDSALRLATLRYVLNAFVDRLYPQPA